MDCFIKRRGEGGGLFHNPLNIFFLRDYVYYLRKGTKMNSGRIFFSSYLIFEPALRLNWLYFFQGMPNTFNIFEKVNFYRLKKSIFLPLILGFV